VSVRFLHRTCMQEDCVSVDVLGIILNAPEFRAVENRSRRRAASTKKNV
jgi:hypothetical protein